ncbi:MAG: hypothetical protein AAGI23_18355 [Bacteroidota bacterium]
MKKKNTRSTLLVLLICASISSAVYLSLVSTSASSSDALPKIELEEEANKNKNRSLPDVDLLKKALKVTERIAYFIQ